MSDIETLERLLRRRPGLGPKERAAIRGLLEENEKLRYGDTIADRARKYAARRLWPLPHRQGPQGGGMSDRETFKLTFEERAKAEQEYGRACDEPEEVAFELVALRSRIDAALALHRSVHNGYERFCSECRDSAHPCPTIKALNGEKRERTWGPPQAPENPLPLALGGRMEVTRD